MKYCAFCGKEIESETKFCPHCGEEIAKDTFGFSSNQKAKKTSKNYQLETILGILAIIFSVLNYLGVIFVHLVGIALGSIVLSLVNKDKKEDNSYSQVGYVTGIIGFVLGIAAVIIGVIFA